MSDDKPGAWPPADQQSPGGGPAPYPSGAPNPYPAGPQGPYPGTGPEQYPGGGPQPYPAAPPFTTPPTHGSSTLPQTITVAFYLMLTGAVVTVLGALLGFTQTDAMRAEIQEQNGSGAAALSQSEIDAAITTGLIFGVILALIQSGLWIWMAYANRAGKNWARITGSVFCGLNALFFVIGLAGAGLVGTASPLTIASGAVMLGIGVAAVCALWHPNSQQHFAPAPPAGYQPYPR